MPDGTTQLAEEYLPATSRATPVVLMRTPYGRRGAAARLAGKALAERGMRLVVQSVRGTSGSGGQFRPFRQERADGLATVDWLRAQPWCDGRVAMIGASYVGHTQWALAPYVRPRLAAMCPGAITSELNESFYPGGALALDNLFSWACTLPGREDPSPRGKLASVVAFLRSRRSMMRLPLAEADRAATGRAVPFWQEILGHADTPDDHWEPAEQRTAIRALDTPVSMVTGWHDPFLVGQLADFTALTAAGNQTRITVGPWAHRDTAMFRATLADQLSWLSTQLGEATNERARRPVRLHIQRANQWREFDQWPPAHGFPRRLHLHRGERLRWHPPADGGVLAEFTYDPADPTPTIGGPMLRGKTRQQNNRRIEARSDVLVCTSDPLRDDLDIVGTPSTELTLDTVPGNADVFVRLCDVDSWGVSRNVTDGILRCADQARASTVRVPLSPTAYRFRRGHRLRIQLAGGAFPRFARNHGTGERPQDAVRVAGIHYRVAAGSYLELPVLPS
ncbi:hypothetical protein EV191_102186 [Tamaricihabitans halophyticus]|uniref:Xaa-Pro dipeptidyl-peptidase C-terminal domain-containing protein n=2 Tax=Tamaricihabitans halophyticus TaxID=1262583 RepID=A0A4R2R6L4_9PSEU|nr:hypothetical protein EV191_102186 [Tamaricihabitans halophyticus]